MGRWPSVLVDVRSHNSPTAQSGPDTGFHELERGLSDCVGMSGGVLRQQILTLWIVFPAFLTYLERVLSSSRPPQCAENETEMKH